MTNATNISWYQSSWLLQSFILFIGTPKNLNFGIFTTGIVFYEFIQLFVTRTNGSWSSTFPISDECAAKDTFIDESSSSFYVQDSVLLLYYDSM